MKILFWSLLLSSLSVATPLADDPRVPEADASRSVPGHKVCSPMPVGTSYVGPMTDHGYSEGFLLTIEPEGLPLLVRTVNACMQATLNPFDPQNDKCKAFAWRDPGRYFRVRELAKTFHADCPAQVGLIGLQEAGERRKGPLRSPRIKCGKHRTYAAECLARRLQQVTGSSVDGRDAKTVGAVVESEWQIKGQYSDWLLSDRKGRGRTQGLIELLLYNPDINRRLRFYSMRFEPGSEDTDKDLRVKQAKRAINIVRRRAQHGELPPILVGDFNHFRDYHQLGGTPAGTSDHSVNIMERSFWRPVDSKCSWIGKWPNINMVYIARTKAFPGPPPCFVEPHESYEFVVPESKGHFAVVEQRRLWMRHQSAVESGDFSFCDEGIRNARLRFDEPIDPASFTIDDTVPEALSVTPVEDSDRCYRYCYKCGKSDVCEFEVKYRDPLCDTPPHLGKLTVGPQIASLDGYVMDQNGDWRAIGGKEDAYVWDKWVAQCPYHKDWQCCELFGQWCVRCAPPNEPCF